jgi:hypothetical protein
VEPNAPEGVMSEAPDGELLCDCSWRRVGKRPCAASGTGHGQEGDHPDRMTVAADVEDNNLVLGGWVDDIEGNKTVGAVTRNMLTAEIVKEEANEIRRHPAIPSGTGA